MTLNEKYILSGLNESQKKAVMTTEGPLLIVAGPGAGKTLTIVRRIAYLVHQGVRPEAILAVTFTNRAAREMKERAAALLGEGAGNMFIGTFHLLGLRILRETRADDFVIVGRDEQVELLKSLLKCPAKKAREAAEKISRFKNSPDDADEETRTLCDAYQSALRQQSAVDFDDLILAPLDILQNDPSNRFKTRFTHIMVDEYQDINPAQYTLLKQLTRQGASLCAIGDSDQAIYAFRGADIGNFLNFEKDFPGAARVTLSENYRSTGSILNAANVLIGNNRSRIDKKVIATREQGSSITILSVPDDRAEGEAIVKEIEARIGGTSHHQMRQRGAAEDHSDRSYRFSDFCVIFRTHAQARVLEEAFNASGIPYQVIGRKGSAQAREIQETLAYLYSLAHPDGAGETARPGDQESKLLSEADYFDPRAETVTLMTLHAAKGLEFPVVFITGVEDGLIPCTIMKDGVDIEEERRLFYVGVTRAKDELFLLHARSRFIHGQRFAPSSSPFIAELPERCKEESAVADKVKKEKPEKKQMGLF
jgi:superfamily I DNA/RNA helicase